MCTEASVVVIYVVNESSLFLVRTISKCLYKMHVKLFSDKPVSYFSLCVGGWVGVGGVRAEAV